MKKYYIGLLALGAVSFGLLIFVVTLGIQSRQDVKTEKSAQEIATKLNSYISKNQEIPSSLSTAGVKDVPDTITYSKISNEKYKFCATYKAAKGYGSSDITSALTSAAMTRAYGSGASSYDNYMSSYEPSELYISYTHKKGEVCQTVKPYINSYDIYNDSSSYIDEYCDPKGKYYSTYKQYCSDTPTTTTPKTTIQ